MRHSSLAVRLFCRLLLLLALTGMGMGFLLYNVADRESNRASDAQLMKAARLLNMMMQDELTAGVLVAHDQVLSANGDLLLSPEEKKAFHASYDCCMFAVFWDGRAVAQSGWGTPVEQLPREPGLHDFVVVSSEWRSYGLAGKNARLLVVVAERASTRGLSVMMALQELAAPLTLLLVFGVLVLWLTLRKSLSIIGRLADTLNARSLAELKPLDPVEWPSDLWPVITALNTLFARLDQAYEREQAFTDDIAHELRTPLAAIRARAQLVHKSLPNVHEDDIARLIACVDRACDLIGGMLIHARLDTVKLSRRSADIHAIVSDVVAEALLDIPSDSIQFTVNPDYIVRWPCDVSSLTIALSAVIDNAVRHAGEGGHVDIAMVRSSERLDIMIADKGPGIPVEDRKRLQRRFERGTSPSSGSGLGLAIAVTAMKLMGGTLILQDRQDGPGLLVILRLPAS
ncbi:hypothetical protein GRI39_05055 [Altererythrobacter indicus]|uniref:histidine kinase n=1 Tax=Altericroceibacterium indicum TaxID=374177 RepID=A0A845A8S6_9SPHN|nr:hypothetical protein [Altericroceibacterium indicum]